MDVYGHDRAGARWPAFVAYFRALEAHVESALAALGPGVPEFLHVS